jgi:tRNA 2-selenouridine synthase
MNFESYLDLVKVNRPIIDVRAPVEYQQGCLVDSVNLPILNDEERTLVGTTYKQQGQAAAIELGHRLVSSENKESKILAWQNYINQNPDSVLTCFRGGLRSQTTQKWLADLGIHVPLLKGGYKKARSDLLRTGEEFCQKKKLIVISGATGCGKSWLLQDLKQQLPTLDLEKLADHRGSAFGAMEVPQPSQASFENRLFCQMWKLMQKPEAQHVMIEDESRMIGQIVQPFSLFRLLRQSPIVLIEESLDTRVEVTYEDYILKPFMNLESEERAQQIFQGFRDSLSKISRKLGGDSFQEIFLDLQMAEKDFFKNRVLETNKIWIRKLLGGYYDHFYFSSLKKRDPKILFSGTRIECQKWLLENAKS